MKVIRSGEVEDQDATDAPIFFGGKVWKRPMVGGGLSKYFSFNVVGFAAGARNKLHTHTSDQILHVTTGTGIVATEDRREVVKEGDTVLIPAGERHWHGATADSDFAHIALMTAESTTTIVE